MHSLVRALFAISDGVCWILVVLGGIGTLASPMALGAFESMERQPLGPALLPVAVVFWLLVAAGSYAVLKRHWYGAVPLLVPAAWLLYGGAGVGYVLAAVVVPAIVLAPYVAVWILPTPPKPERAEA